MKSSGDILRPSLATCPLLSNSSRVNFSGISLEATKKSTILSPARICGLNNSESFLSAMKSP